MALPNFRISCRNCSSLSLVYLPPERQEQCAKLGTYFVSILCDAEASKDWGFDAELSIWCGRFRLGVPVVGCRLSFWYAGIDIGPGASTAPSSSTGSCRLIRCFL